MLINEEDLQKADDILMHFGVKGMRWGHRKSRSTLGVSRATDAMAKKDAEEFARAQMFYGKGAGTRRKLINKSVEDRMKRDPQYAKAFDAHLKNQDMSKHATKAVNERDKTDRKERNSQRRNAVARRVTGERGTQAAFVGLAFLAGTPQGRRAVKNGVQFISSTRGGRIVRAEAKIAINSAKRKIGAKKIAYMLSKMA